MSILLTMYFRKISNTFMSKLDQERRDQGNSCPLYALSFYPK